MSRRPFACSALLLASLVVASPAQGQSGGPMKGACLAAASGAERPSPVRTCRRTGKARHALPGRVSARPSVR